MLKVIGIILLLLIFIFFMVVTMFASAILSFIHKFRKMSKGGYTRDEDSDYMGRRQQQYAYRHSSGNGSSNQQANRQQAYTQQDETIIDTRSMQQSSKKIFDDNEGEYVDYVEEN